MLNLVEMQMVFFFGNGVLELKQPCDIGMYITVKHDGRVVILSVNATCFGPPKDLHQALKRVI